MASKDQTLHTVQDALPASYKPPEPRRTLPVSGRAGGWPEVTVTQAVRGWVQTRPSSPTASRHSQRHNSVIYTAVWALLILSPHGGAGRPGGALISTLPLPQEWGPSPGLSTPQSGSPVGQTRGLAPSPQPHHSARPASGYSRLRLILFDESCLLPAAFLKTERLPWISS